MKVSVLFLCALLLFTGCESKNENSITANGVLEYKTVTIASKSSGEILRLLKDEGASIQVGDTLLLVDTTLYSLQLLQQQANLSAARAQYELLSNGARNEDIASAVEILTQAQVNAASAKKDFSRLSALLGNGSITDKQFDDAKSRMEMTESQMKQAEITVKKLQSLTRPEELQNAAARIAQSEAAVALARKNVQDCFVIAPQEGVVLKRYFRQGENVTPQSALLKIADTKTMEVTLYLTALEIPKITLNGVVGLRIDGMPGKEYAGKVVFISPDAEFTPKNIQTPDERTKLVFAVKVSCENTSGELKGGLPAVVSFR